MGNPTAEGVPADSGTAPIRTYFSTDAWIEGAAVDQLHSVAGLTGVRQVVAFPDLHPGKYGPVGCAIQVDRLYPHLIGNDIGCGVALFALDLPARKLRIDKAAERLRALEGAFPGDAAEQLKAAGLDPDLHAHTLGSIGGGNHFCELQAVAEIADQRAANAIGLDAGSTLLLVHSGSRSLGTEIFGSIGFCNDGVDPESPAGCAYLSGHDTAVAWSRLNRRIIAERAARALRADLHLICDVPHNLIETHANGFLHRKGAAKADVPFVPLAGSRDAASYLLQPTGAPEAMASLAHGAGRKYDRKSMMGRAGTNRSQRARLARTSFGGLVVCDDRQLLIEEAPAAYKDPERVLSDLTHAGLAREIGRLEPKVTFKKATATNRNDRQPDKRRSVRRRRPR